MSSTTNSTRPGTLAPAFGTHTGNTEAGTELRRHRRARAAWPARLLNKAGSIINVMVCDVSEGGVGLLGQTNLPLGTVFDITLSVPHPKEPGRTHAVRAHVRVMFSSFVGAQCRIGVQFVELPMAARIAIRSYVLARS
jgi:c-di-GMP-binding flagellar brake protein YcgR